VKKLQVENTNAEKVNIEKSNKLRHNVGLLYSINIVSNMVFISPVLILFFEDWAGLNFMQIMTLQSWFVGCIVILEIPSGTIADYLGRKMSMIIGHFFELAGIFIYTSAPIYWRFFLGEFMFALAHSCFSGANEAMVYDTLIELGRESESKKVYGLLNTSMLIGFSVGAFLGSIIAMYYGPRVSFLSMVIPMGASFIICLTLHEPMPNKMRKRSDKYLTIMKKGFQHIRKNKIVSILILDTIIISTISYYMLWLWQKRLMVLHVNVEYFGIINVGMVIGQIIMVNSFHKLEKIWKSKKCVVQLTAIGSGIGFVIFMISDNLIAIISGIIIAVSFGRPRFQLMLNYLNKHIPSDQRATIISIQSMLNSLIFAVINPIMGVFVDYSMRLVMLILGIIAVVWGIITPTKEEYLKD
jgi:MFS family permease